MQSEGILKEKQTNIMSFFHTRFPLLILAFTSLPPLFATADKCSQQFSTEIDKFTAVKWQHCRQKTLGAEFAWNFNNKSRQLDIAFGVRLHADSGWLAWGLNPHGPHMVETRALIGIKHSNGSRECNKYNITEANKRGCPLLPSDDIGLNVSQFKFEYMEEIEYYVILATIILPDEFNSSRTNVVWQIGEAESGSEPKMHPKSLNNLNSAETLDFDSGNIISYAAHQRRRLRLAHGILNIVGWGTLLPIGVIVVRYFKAYPKQWPWWFIFHVNCQISGYIIGSMGWALGIWLGKTSKYYTFHTHQIIGIIIFTFTTIQMLALRLRPKEADAYRTYWNMYHHFLGYTLLALISTNIFVGIKILGPDHVWKWAYIGVLGVLGTVALACEVFSWIKFLMERSNSPST